MVRLEVPYISGVTRDFCLPLSITMVLTYYGFNIHQETVASRMSHGITGFDFDKMTRKYLRQIGFRGRLYHGSLDNICDNIDAGIPLVCHVTNFSRPHLPHMLVACGYDDKSILVQDPADRDRKEIEVSKFLRGWRKNYAIRIVPNLPSDQLKEFLSNRYKPPAVNVDHVN